MPTFQVELQDGRAFEIESDLPPSEQDVMQALGVGFDDRTAQGRVPMSQGTQAEFLARQAANSNPESMGVMDKVLANPLVGGATEVLADIPRNLYNLPAYGVNAIAGRPVMKTAERGESVLPEFLPSLEDMAKVPIAFPPDAMSPFPDTTPKGQPMPTVAGLAKGVEDVGRGLLTPENIMALGAGANPKLMQAIGTLFGVTSAAHLPQAAAEVGRLSVEGTPAETARAGLNAVAQAAIAGHIAGKAGLNTKYTPREKVLNPEVVDGKGGIVTEPGRMLMDKPGDVIDLEAVKTGEGTVYRPPGEQLKQLEGPKGEFVVDPIGQTMDMGQLTPKERTEFMRGPREYSPLPEKKGYSPEPPVINTPEQQVVATLKNIEARLNEMLGGQKPTPAIIPANQALGTKNPEGQLPTQEIAGLSPSSSAANRPGSAFREPVQQTQQGMYNTEKDYGIPNEPTTGQMPVNPTPGPGRPSQKQLERKALEEGLTMPSGYYSGSEPLSYGKEGQYPAEGGPTGTLSQLQRDRILAGQRDVRAMQSNNPPLPDIAGGVTRALMPMGSDAASLPAQRKMIAGEGQSATQQAKAPQSEDGKLPLNPGGSEAMLTPEQQAKSRQNNSLREFARANGVEFVEGDNGQSILKKIQGKKASGSTVEADKLPPENFTHILGNIQQKVKNAEYLGDITKDQAEAYRVRGDKIFEQSHTDPAGAREQAKKLNEEVGGDKKDPRTGQDLYGGLFFLDPKFWKNNFGKDSYVAQDAKQLYNRIKNKINEKSQAWKELDVAEFREFMKEGVKRTPSEVEAWVRSHAEKVRTNEEKKNDEWWKGVQKEVEVKKFSTKQESPESKEYAQLTHKLETILTQAQHRNLIFDVKESKGDLSFLMKKGWEKGIAEQGLRKVELYDRIEKQVSEPQSHWQSVAPKAESDMKDYVEIAVVRPTTRPVRDLYRENPPADTDEQMIATDAEQTKEDTSAGVKFPSSHNFPPNTLGFVRGYMEGDTFHVIEVQSDWAQKVRDAKEHVKANEEIGAYNPNNQRAVDHYNKLNDPLLAHYERLALKSAIEHARASGAKRIAIQDAESAMLMEGHDRTAGHKVIELDRKYHDTDADWKELEARYPKPNYAIELRNDYSHKNELIVFDEFNKEVPQEKGMRHHYDRVMPQILEELTGSKGEKVSFGEHKMAYHQQDNLGTGDALGDKRSDLIFKNPDGTPKTDVSARVYPLERVKESVPQTGQGIGGGMQRAVERNKEAGAIPNPFRKVNRPIKSSEFQDLPEFKPYSQEVTEATTPQGIGRWLAPAGKAGRKLEGSSNPVLEKTGNLITLFAGADPRATATTPAGKAIIANAVMAQKGQNFAALWMERHRDVQRAFEVDDNGRFTNANGGKEFMSDVIEAELKNPGSQRLTPGQKQFVAEWKSLRQKFVDMAVKEGVKFFVDEDTGLPIPINAAYFPRPAVGKVGIKEGMKAAVRKQVGGKQFFAKGRQFQTESEGRGKFDIVYEPDEYARIGRWVTSIYKAIADTRLADDPALQGRPGRPKLLEEGMVFQPAFAGRVFPTDVAKRLNQYYGETTHNWVRALASINDQLKAAQFTLDGSAPFNQGLPLMGVNPLRWAKATALSYKAFLDDRVLNKYLKQPENVKYAKMITENGGSLIRLQDFLQGAGKGNLLHGVAPIRASGRSMGNFLTIAKIELMKAFEPIAKEKGWSTPELVEAVENAVLSGKMEMVGLSPGRTLGERLLFNAPSYIRGAVNLTAMAGQGKISGKVARRALIGMATAITATLYALYKMSGMDDDEIVQRFDPRNPNFYRYPHLMSDGRRKEIGYGNIMISLARLLGSTVDIATGKKELGVGTKGDPWLRWLSYRQSPLGNLIWQLRTGEDYRGEPIGKMETFAKSVVPVSIEPLTEKGTRESKTLGVAAQAFGLSTFDESPGAYRRRLQDETAKQKYGTNYFGLSMKQRGKVGEEVDPRVKALGEKTTPRQVMSIVEASDKRRKNLVESLSPENREWLTSRKLEVMGYQDQKNVNGNVVRLANDEEKVQLAELMSKYTEEAIGKLRVNNREYSQERVNEVMELAHKKAWRDFKKSKKQQ